MTTNGRSRNGSTPFSRPSAQPGADVLQGSILFVSNAAGPKPVADIRHPTGPVGMLEGAGNLLIRRRVLEETQAPWFDPDFALTGGEDRDFFMRLKFGGYRFAWADEARAFGEVAEIRQDLGWVLRRAYSNGNSDMRVLIKHGPGFSLIVREGAKIAGALLLSLPHGTHSGLESESPARAAHQILPGGGQADGDGGRALQ